jgi:hypothetical protein
MTTSVLTHNIEKSIHLYRRCLRSIKQIRDPCQQAPFLAYARDCFRSRKYLYPDSREAHIAYNDGLEQVKSMEYYQQMAKLKGNKINTKEFLVRDESPNPESLSSSLRTHGNSLLTSLATNTEVEQWILSQLPHMNKDDASKYAHQLYELGFDSVAFIEEDLLEEDLPFMKKAHRRVLMRQLSKIRAEMEVE